MTNDMEKTDIGLRYTWTAILAATIFYVAENHPSLLPADIQKFMANYGKHLCGCFAITILLAKYVHCFEVTIHWFRLWMVAVVVAFGSTWNELNQVNLPGRVVDKWDVVAQMVGAFTAVLLPFCFGPHDKLERR